MNKKRIFLLLASIFMCLQLVSCSNGEKMQDGYYTAELSEYNNGWKEYVTICVMEDQIVSVEYNAKNASGFIKSWDMAYMRTMNAIQGTYPNKYTRTYASQLMENQNTDNIDMVSGASSSGGNFIRLADAVIEKAKNGDTTIAVVEVEE